MKKTVKWLLAALLFVFIGLQLFDRISEVLRKKAGGVSDMISTFYDIEENTLDVLCLGSSHGYSSFQPNFLWEEYGLTSYMLGSQRQTIASTWYLLEDALNYQSPKVVVIEAYYFFYGKKYADEASLRNVLDGMPMGKAKYEAIEDILSDFTFQEKLSWYLPFLMYHSRWDELKDYDFNNQPFLKGAIQDYTVDPMEEPRMPQEAAELPDIFYEYFEKIVTLCEEKGIELVLYAAPYGYGDEDDEKSYEIRQGINYTLEEYLGELGIPFIWYQKTNEVGIDYANDFRDYAHLNTYGAEKITADLGAFLTENYDLPDHRGDEAYQSWEEDYQKFLAEAEVLQAGG